MVERLGNLHDLAKRNELRSVTYVFEDTSGFVDTCTIFGNDASFTKQLGGIELARHRLLVDGGP